MTFGLTPLGFNAMRLADIKQALDNAFIAEFGDINLDPQSVFGQEIGVLSKSLADIWENLENVYFSQYPNSASGVSLDNVVQLNAITRLPATQTSVTATLFGDEGTFIPQGSLAKIVSTGQVFFSQSSGSITRQNADIVTVQVGTVTTQPYTVILSNRAFTYSLPTITFSNVGDIFVTGNTIKLTINGTQLSTIPFNTDSDTTLADIASSISAFIAGTTATPTNPDVIDITPATGSNITINQILIQGGATQASSVITFRSPSDANEIATKLTSIINANSPPWLCVDNLDGTFTITANSPSAPFSCNVGLNLDVIAQASPFIFLADDFGPIPLPANTLTFIQTPIAGWISINNSIAGVTGRFIETDAELRIRRANSIKLLAAATVEAIRAGLLQKVTGVTSALVFENRTLTQAPIQVVFPAQFDPSDTITVTYNTLSNFTVPFNTNQATTMGDLVTAFEALPEVASASFGGTGNQTVTVLMNIFNVLLINSAETDVSAQSAQIKGGRPPKSFEAVVQGGSDDDIANQIWLTKPAGIETFGNVNNGNGIPITDSQGGTQIIFFSRPQEVFISVQVALTLYSEETFPVNGIVLVQNAINNYGNSLGVGIDVLFQRVLAQIFQVPGIASGNMQIAATALETDAPVYGTADIPIAENEISVFDLTRITVTVV